jgi:hypothetical protein
MKGLSEAESWKQEIGLKREPGFPEKKFNLDSLGLLGFSLGFKLDLTWILAGFNLDSLGLPACSCLSPANLRQMDI